MTLKAYCALCFKTRASFGAHHEHLNGHRTILYISDEVVGSPMTLDSGNIMFMRIFAGFPWSRGSNDSWVIENIDFQGFRRGRYVFGTLGNEAIIIIYSIIQSLVAFPLTPKYMTLNG